MNSSTAKMNRRFFLRATGLSLALPLLESLTPRALGSGLALGSHTGNAIAATRPRRMVCIGNMLGFYQPEFFPTQAGRDYVMPSLLRPLASHRDDFTLFSGLDHGLKGGHFAIHSFLSGIRSMDAKSMPEGNISVDQRAAETIGGATRFPSLTIGSQDGIHGGCMMSWTRSGTRVPPISTPNALFRRLFHTEDSGNIAQRNDQFDLQSSILDAVHGDAKSLTRKLGNQDRDKLDEYFTSVRDVERQIAQRRRWADVPMPKPGMEEPRNTDFVSDLPVLYDLIALALQTDSTRIATLEIGGDFESRALGISKGYHALSHHGKVQASIDDLLKLEHYQMEQFSRFLTKMKSIQDGETHLLDHTQVLFGSGMGNANAHTNSNLPLILAGGGFGHGEHREYPLKGHHRVPLSNLYLTMLQHFGVETDRFSLSSSTIRDFA